MKTKRISLLLILAVVLSLAVSVSAASHPLLNDEAGLLTAGEAAEISNLLTEISRYSGLDVAIVTVDSLDGASPMAYADDYFDYNGFGQGANRDGVLLLICMNSRDWWISTRGYGITAFTDAGLDYLSEQFLPDLSDGNYAAAFRSYANLCDKFIAQARTGKPYDAGNLPKSPFPIVGSLLISLVAAFIIALIVSLILRGNLKSVQKQTGAHQYIVPGSMQITRAHDHFLYHKVNRVKRETNSSGSSGGSSTHTSSSGASHGGRGGKF